MSRALKDSRITYLVHRVLIKDVTEGIWGSGSRVEGWRINHGKGRLMRRSPDPFPPSGLGYLSAHKISGSCVRVAQDTTPPPTPHASALPLV